MATWSEILTEATKESTFDLVRRKYLKKLHETTGRNIIAYYSGWLQKPALQKDGGVEFGINDSDKNGLMATVHGLDRSLGLDLLMHTPGGSMAATESLVEYLRQMFGSDIRAFVPQLAMSAGTMIACSCKEIHMGKQSSIGPIDPQLGGMPAHGLLEEFRQAAREIKRDQSKVFVWQPILQKIQPTWLSECRKVSDWAKVMVQEWLETNMLSGVADKKARAKKIVRALSDTSQNKSHSRHIGVDRAEAIGLEIRRLEKDQALQDAVLSVHHAFILTLQSTAAFKVTENHLGNAFIQQAQIAVRVS